MYIMKPFSKFVGFLTKSKSLSMKILGAYLFYN
jgi:hypothetical protein